MRQKFMVPVEPLFALGIIGVLGFGAREALRLWQWFENDGKPRRYNVDRWDRRMMERDSRITGNVNIQQANVEAPVEFSRNSALELERPLI